MEWDVATGDQLQQSRKAAGNDGVPIRELQCVSAHLQVRVEEPDEGADGRVAAGFEDHKSSWTVLSPEEKEAGQESNHHDCSFIGSTQCSNLLDQT